MDYKPELMSPAGSMEALRAAVQNGADAVYLGGKRFNARHSAGNFDDQAMKQAVEYAHIRGVKVYVTLNILLGDNEIKDAVRYLEFIYEIGADAVIIQDMGLVSIIKDKFPGMEIHGSTQMTIYDTGGARFLEGLGVSRVVLAREVPLEDVKYISSHSSLELEVFVQGALCMCYSGQCLMSSVIGGRSGNRGKCAQPCRLKYSIVDRRRKDSVYREGYLLSPRDLFTLDSIDRVMAAGVSAVKIEGRMKRPEYVAAVTACYRKAIDACTGHGRPVDLRECTDTIRRVFNRNFTGGYLLGDGYENFLSGERPDNRGVPLGRVMGYDREKGKAAIELSDKLSRGDGIEIQTGETTVGIKVSSIEVKDRPADKAEKGSTVAVGVKHSVGRGDGVFKTYDRLLMERLARSYEGENRKIQVICASSFRVGKPAEMYFWDDRDNMVSVKGEHPVEEALKAPLSPERIREQLCKTGDAPYIISRVDIEADSNIFLPVSEINRMRRAGLEKLSEKRTGYRQPADTGDVYRQIAGLYEDNKAAGPGRAAGAYIAVETGDPGAVCAFAEAGADRIYIRYSEDIMQNLGSINTRIPLFVKLPLITGHEDLSGIIRFIREKGKTLYGIEVSNPGQLEALKDVAEGIKLHGGVNLNIFNSFSVEAYTSRGCDTVTLSVELSLSRIKGITGLDRCEAVVHGRLTLMILEYPLLNNLPPGSYGLKDRKGMIFPLFRDGTGRTEVCNSRELFMLDKIKDVMETGVGGIRLIHRDEHTEEFSRVIENYRKAVKGLDYDKNLTDRIVRTGITRGHFYRGV